MQEAHLEVDCDIKGERGLVAAIQSIEDIRFIKRVQKVNR